MKYNDFIEYIFKFKQDHILTLNNTIYYIDIINFHYRISDSNNNLFMNIPCEYHYSKETFDETDYNYKDKVKGLLNDLNVRIREYKLNEFLL